MNSLASSVIVSYSNSGGEDAAVLIVGQKKPGKDAEIVNAFQGKEATELWKKLITRKEKNNA